MPAKQKNPSSTTLQDIKGKLLISRLQAYVLDTTGDIQMSAGQISGCIALLKKTHPDLAAMKVEASGAVQIEVLQVASHAPAKVGSYDR